MNQEWFSHIHSAAPFLIVAIDTVVASALSMQYSARSGIKAPRALDDGRVQDPFGLLEDCSL